MNRLIIRRFSLVILVNLSVCFSMLRGTDGQERPDEPSIDVEFASEPEIRQRQVTFVESQEEIKIELFAADPKLLDQRFAATIVLAVPDRREYSVAARAVPADQLALYSAALFGRVPGMSGTRSAADVFQSLADRTPAEHRPPAEVLSLLLNDQYHFRILAVARTRNAPSARLELQVLGPTVEMTKAMSQALLNLYDYGLSIPIQKQLIADMEERKAQLPEVLARINAEWAKVEPLAKSLEEFEPIRLETIAELRTQARLIGVDIAGAQARIDACGEILSRADVRESNTRDHVESMKITAEIELVGLAARQQAIGKIIDDGNRRQELEAKKGQQEALANKLQKELASRVQLISDREQARQLYGPVAIERNTIVIQPLKWEPASRSGFGTRPFSDGR